MKIENFLLAIGLFSLVVVMFMGTTISMSNNYADLGINVPVDNSTSAVFDKAAEIDAQARSMQEKVSDIPSGPLSAVTGFISAAWATIISTLSGIGMSISLVQAISEFMQIPAPLAGFIISAIIITIVLLIAKMVFNVSSGD
jgi:hypothetical protein